MSMPAIEHGTKRVVVRHTDGLYQILGTAIAQPDPVIEARFNGKPTPIALVASTPRYYLFVVR